MSATAELSASVAVPAPAPASVASPSHPHYTCACGHEFQVFGRGRHRVYFELSDQAFTDPVMSGACPDCGRTLPGKHVA